MKNKARKPDFEIKSAAIKVLLAFAVIGTILLVFRVCQKLVSPDRAAGARRVSPRLAQAIAGLPRPAVVLAPAVSVLPPELSDAKLFPAIRMKEGWKGGSEPGPDGEYGPYQITRDWYEDACKAAGVVPDSPGWQWPEVAFHRAKVEFLMVHYWLYWLGPDADDYSKALAHRGGPPSGQDIRNHVYAREVLNIKMAMGGE